MVVPKAHSGTKKLPHVEDMRRCAEKSWQLASRYPGVGKVTVKISEGAEKDVEEIVFADSQDATRPRLLVSLQSIVTLKEVGERQANELEDTQTVLNLCRSAYYKEIIYLRELVRRLREDADALVDEDVYFFHPPSLTVSPEIKEAFDVCLRELTRKLRTELYRLRAEVDMWQNEMTLDKLIPYLFQKFECADVVQNLLNFASDGTARGNAILEQLREKMAPKKQASSVPSVDDEEVKEELRLLKEKLREQQQSFEAELEEAKMKQLRLESELTSTLADVVEMQSVAADNENGESRQAELRSENNILEASLKEKNEEIARLKLEVDNAMKKAENAEADARTAMLEAKVELANAEAAKAEAEKQAAEALAAVSVLETSVAAAEKDVDEEGRNSLLQQEAEASLQRREEEERRWKEEREQAEREWHAEREQQQQDWRDRLAAEELQIAQMKQVLAEQVVQEKEMQHAGTQVEEICRNYVADLYPLLQQLWAVFKEDTVLLPCEFKDEDQAMQRCMELIDSCKAEMRKWKENQDKHKEVDLSKLREGVLNISGPSYDMLRAHCNELEEAVQALEKELREKDPKGRRSAPRRKPWSSDAMLEFEVPYYRRIMGANLGKKRYHLLFHDAQCQTARRVQLMQNGKKHMVVREQEERESIEVLEFLRNKNQFRPRSGSPTRFRPSSPTKSAPKTPSTTCAPSTNPSRPITRAWESGLSSREQSRPHTRNNQREDLDFVTLRGRHNDVFYVPPEMDRGYPSSRSRSPSAGSRKRTPDMRRHSPDQRKHTPDKRASTPDERREVHVIEKRPQSEQRARTPRKVSPRTRLIAFPEWAPCRVEPSRSVLPTLPQGRVIKKPTNNWRRETAYSRIQLERSEMI